MRLGGVNIGVQWFSWWAYDHMPLSTWLYAEAHDDDSFFWRVMGLEINVPKEQQPMSDNEREELEDYRAAAQAEKNLDEIGPYSTLDEVMGRAPEPSPLEKYRRVLESLLKFREKYEAKEAQFATVLNDLRAAMSPDEERQIGEMVKKARKR